MRRREQWLPRTRGVGLLRWAMKILSTVSFIVLGVIVFGHTQSETTAAKSVFPKGNAKTGKEMFEIKGCHRCHVIQGEKFPEIDLPAIDMISLGGISNAGWRRDDYAGNILDPQHQISIEHVKSKIILGDKQGAESSPMPDFIDKLSVRNLIDIATYLEEITK